jgi:hypothetical protein
MDLIIDHNSDFALSAFPTKSVKETSKFLNDGIVLQKGRIYVRGHHHCPLEDQVPFALVVAPDSAARRKGGCSSEQSAE